MKQHIARKQLFELNREALGKYAKWCFNTLGNVASISWVNDDEENICDLPLLTIGQMIEFLYEYEGEGQFNFSYGEVGVEPTGFFVTCGQKKNKNVPSGERAEGSVVVAWDRGYIWKDSHIVKKADCGELCDALWEAVKEVLKNENTN